MSPANLKQKKWVISNCTKSKEKLWNKLMIIISFSFPLTNYVTFNTLKQPKLKSVMSVIMDKLISWYVLIILLGALEVSIHLILSKTISSISRQKTRAKWSHLPDKLNKQEKELRLPTQVVSTKESSLLNNYHILLWPQRSVSEVGRRIPLPRCSSLKPQNLWIPYVVRQRGIKIANGIKDANLLNFIWDYPGRAKIFMRTLIKRRWR